MHTAEARAEPPAGWLLQVVAFLGTAAAVLAYALPGGTYDTVIRGEFAIVLWWVLTLGLTVGVLPRSRPTAPALVVVVALVALGVWTAASLTWNESNERTVAEIARVAHHLAVFAIALCLFSRRTWHAAAGGLTAGAVIVCVLAFISRLAPDVLVTELYGPEGGKRLAYPLNYWNATAAWGAMTLAMMLAWSAHGRVAVRALALGAVPVIAAGTFLTYSRAGAIGVVAGTLLVLVINSRRWQTLLHAVLAAAFTAPVIVTIRSNDEILEGTGTAGASSVVLVLVLATLACAAVAAASGAAGVGRVRAPRRVARPAVAVSVIAALAAGLVVGPGLADRAWDSFSTTESSIPDDPAKRLNLSGNRYNIFASAIEAAEEHPWKGVGAGGFEFWWNVDARHPEFIRDGHSLYLETAGELGVVGVLSLIALLAGGGWLCVVARHRTSGDDTVAAVALTAAAAVFLVHAGVDWVWESTAVAALALAALGLLGAATASPRARTPRIPLRLLAAVAGIVAIAVQLPPTVSTSALRDSQEAARAGDQGAALADATSAIEAAPWSASAYLQRALVLEAQGRLAAARADAQRAVDREPTNWRHPLVLARLDAALGRVDEALASYRKARSLRSLGKAFERSDR